MYSLNIYLQTVASYSGVHAIRAQIHKGEKQEGPAYKRLSTQVECNQHSGIFSLFALVKHSAGSWPSSLLKLKKRCSK